MIILHEEVIFSNGNIRHVRRWIYGWVQGIGGKFTVGLTGSETIVELDVIKPLQKFEVRDDKADQPHTVDKASLVF